MDLRRHTGEGGGNDMQPTEMDDAVEDIIGRDSPAYSGLNVAESGFVVDDDISPIALPPLSCAVGSSLSLLAEMQSSMPLNSQSLNSPKPNLLSRPLELGAPKKNSSSAPTLRAGIATAQSDTEPVSIIRRNLTQYQANARGISLIGASTSAPISPSILSSGVSKRNRVMKQTEDGPELKNRRLKLQIVNLELTNKNLILKNYKEQLEVYRLEQELNLQHQVFPTFKRMIPI